MVGVREEAKKVLLTKPNTALQRINDFIFSPKFEMGIMMRESVYRLAIKIRDESY